MTKPVPVTEKCPPSTVTTGWLTSSQTDKWAEAEEKKKDDFYPT